MMIKRLPELSRIIPLVLFCLVISCKKQVPEEAPIVIKKEIEGNYSEGGITIDILAEH